MKKYISIAVGTIISVASIPALAGSLFTDVTSHSAPSMVTQINAGLDALEDSIDGTTPQTSPIVQGTLTAISTNGVTTNVVITVDGVVDGETIGDDTIDDDSIDFSDVTAADLTFAEGDITDSTIVTADIKDGDISDDDLNLTDITLEDFTGTITAAGTNSASGSITIDIGGTNYLINIYPN